MDNIKNLEKILEPKDYEAYTNYSYDEQNALFLKFKRPFDELNKTFDIDGPEKFKLYLEQAVILAVSGNPVAQDFLVYIYKKGRTGLFESNLLRAYEWGIIASNSICMLSMDRMKFFFNPAFDKIAESDKLQHIIEKYDLNEFDIEYFFATNIANMMMSCSDISLERMSKEPIIPQSFSDFKIRELERIRDRVIENMLELLYRD